MLSLSDLAVRSPTLGDCVQGMGPAALLALGQVVCAYEVRRHYRKKVKPCEEALSVAIREEQSMGGFEDCGEFYRAALVEAKVRLAEAQQHCASAEKFYKRQGHQFREQFPQVASVLSIFEQAALRHYKVTDEAIV